MPALAGSRSFLIKFKKLNNQPVATASQHKQGMAIATVPEIQDKQGMATASWHSPTVALWQLLLFSEQWHWLYRNVQKQQSAVGEQSTAMALATVQQSKLCFASIVAVLSLGGGRF